LCVETTVHNDPRRLLSSQPSLVSFPSSWNSRLSVSTLSPLVFLVNASPQAIPLSPQPRSTMLLSLIMSFWSNLVGETTHEMSCVAVLGK
jgi:hypothetical protein